MKDRAGELDGVEPQIAHQRAMRRIADRQADLLPVEYYHLVFTLPAALNPWVELHDRELYDLLFETVWATLLDDGVYLASPATLYRILRNEHGEVVERRRQATHPPRSARVVTISRSRVHRG